MTNVLYPRNPSRILTTAFKLGMASTLALGRDRSTGKARPLYFGQGNRIKGMVKIWDRAKQEYQQTVEEGHPDASKLLKAENNVRRSFSRILLKTSVRYGNTETRRVKREEGNKKYLNILWDYSGSRLRDVTKARYFFPKPVQIEMDDGTVVDGYHGSSRMPIYPVRHNHLPELDFADMIRSPLMELARQCLKYGVPPKIARKYIDALLFRLLPFLDYVYTKRRSGRSNYVRDGLRELRVVVEQIQNEYGTRNGRRQSITSEVMEAITNDTPLEIEVTYENHCENADEFVDDHILQEVVDEAKSEGAILDEPLQTLANLLENGILNEKDSVELLREYQEQSRRQGVKIHRFVSNNFQSPFSFNGVVYHGTEMVYDNSGLILVSEIPVDDGRGRLDFILARAKKQIRVDGAPSVVTFEPFMIVDLKTKSAFDFDIYGIESRSKTEENVIREFILGHREMTNDEWSEILSTTPDNYETEQLDAYEKAVLADYQRVMWSDVDAQKNLTKAVLVVDSCQSWKDISEAILPLIMRAYQGCIDGTLSEGNLLIPFKEQRELRIAMRMLSVTRPTTKTEELDIPIPQNPFKYRVEDQKEFQLYLTVSGSGSPSQSAASIAERWHGLEYIFSLAKKRHRDVFWFDLVGEYTDPVLRKKQFRMKHHIGSIQRFFRDRVQMQNLSEQVRAFVYEGAPISYIRTWLQSQLREGRNPLIVVSGWESLRRSTPNSHQMYLDEIVTTLIQTVPAKSTTIWFARPVPIAQSSITYSTRCVAPFYQGSFWQNIVDTIIWNVAMPPDRSGARVSTNYHERGILIEQPKKPLEWKIVEVGPLRGWGQDFQSGGRKIPEAYYRRNGGIAQQSRWYIEKQLERTLELIPHLLPHHEYNPVPRSDFDLEIEEMSAEHSTLHDSRPRLIFNPAQIHTELETDGRVKELRPMDDINRRRECRQMQLTAVPHQQRTTRPPSEYYLTSYKLDYRRIALTEILHLKDTVKFMNQDTEIELKDLVDSIEGVLAEVHREDSTSLMNTLRLVRQILETNPLSKQVWEQLLSCRSTMSRNLTITQRKHVTTLQMKHPDILLLIGNHLHLLLLAALGSIPEVTFTRSLVSLWDYIRPWQLIGLGMKPTYPKSHITGRSVLDRHRLLERLCKRIVNKNRFLDLQISLTNVRYGQLIALPSSGTADSILLCLLFQRNPGINDMNAALLNPRGIDPSLDVVDALQEMVSGRTFWSESDLNLLSWHARLQGDETRVQIMVAEQHGEQILWIDDQKGRKWIPFGRLHYTTRRFEDVTLLRTLELSEIRYLQPLEYDDVRRPYQRLEDMILRALLILNRGLEGCVSSTCKVMLDTGAKMYRVVFTDRDSENVIGEMLVHRTVDLLEILRRPDTDCEPVIVKEQRLIWNRFRDISYDEDVALLKPWVARRDPFPEMSLNLPPTAQDLLSSSKELDITIELYHDPWTCPLKHISLEDIDRQHRLARSVKHHYLFYTGSSYGEPVHVSNEPGVHHGSCWRVHIDTPIKITPELREIIETRFTDGQVRSLLSSQEIIYWSKERQTWVTHTFKLVVRESCIEEVKESWHLRMMVAELTGQRYDSQFPGLYLQNPDTWNPYIIIEPEYVTVGLRKKETRQTREKRVSERNVALKYRFQVQELLEGEMKGLLEELGIVPNRRLTSEIQGAIADSLEIYGLKEGKAEVEFDGVI
ncbi:MAG: hypothetical protein E4H14_08815, partial [Candidatus Thorarchaeota archaeon]